MRAYWASVLQYSCHVSNGNDGRVCKSCSFFFLSPSLSSCKKEMGRKDSSISFNLTTEMWTLIPTSISQTEMQASSLLSIEHGSLSPLPHISEAWVHLRCLHELLLRSHSSWPSGYNVHPLNPAAAADVSQLCWTFYLFTSVAVTCYFLSHYLWFYGSPLGVEEWTHLPMDKVAKNSMCALPLLI